MFDGATVLLMSLQSSSALPVGTVFNDSVTDSYGSSPLVGEFATANTTYPFPQSEKFTITYNDDLISNGQANNVFQIVRNKTGYQTSIASNFNNDQIDGMTLITGSGHATDASSTFAFRFDANTFQINGILNVTNNVGQCVSAGITNSYGNAFVQLATGTSNNQSVGQHFFWILQNGAPYTTVLTSSMDLGTCCTETFTSAQPQQIVCKALGLDSTSANFSTCDTFFNQASSGWCWTNPTSGSCNKFCQQSAANCDLPLAAYCSGLNQSLSGSATGIGIYADNTPQCDCFLPAASQYLINFESSLTNLGLGVLDSQPMYCKLPKCSQATLIPFNNKAAGFECTSLTVCVSSLSVDNNGTMGALNTAQTQACGSAHSAGTGTGGSSSSGSGVSILYIGVGVCVAVVVAIVAIWLLIRVLKRKPPKRSSR